MKFANLAAVHPIPIVHAVLLKQLIPALLNAFERWIANGAVLVCLYQV